MYAAATLAVMCSILLILHTNAKYVEKYYTKDKCFPIKTAAKGNLLFNKIPKVVDMTISCDGGSSEPSVESAVYSVPTVWSEFCTDKDNHCCTKSFSSSRCSHEIEAEQWKSTCTSNWCRLTLPRMDMSYHCNFHFQCKNATCFSRWVDVTYKCYHNIKDQAEADSNNLPEDGSKKQLNIVGSPLIEGKQSNSWHPPLMIVVMVVGSVLLFLWRYLFKLSGVTTLFIHFYCRMSRLLHYFIVVRTKCTLLSHR